MTEKKENIENKLLTPTLILPPQRGRRKYE
jgi:hypothetical protein